MKLTTKFQLFFFAASVALLQSCGADLVTAEEMKAEQEAYEINKREVIAKKGGFFKKNKQALFDKASKLARIFDTYKSKDISNTDTLYKHPEPILLIPFSSKGFSNNISALDKKGASIGLRLIMEYKDTTVNNDLVDVLRSCDTTDNLQACVLADQDPMQTLLEANYLFVEETLLKIAPSVKSSTEFDGGVYIKQMTCIDILDENPIYSFTSISGNNEEVTSVSYGGRTTVSQFELNNDLERKAAQEMKSNLNKHFRIVH